MKQGLELKEGKVFCEENLKMEGGIEEESRPREKSLG